MGDVPPVLSAQLASSFWGIIGWRPPFGVLSETPASNNPYFMTGAGGLLQAVLNGFCGLQVTEEGIVQLPSVLPPHWKKVTVTGVGIERKTYFCTRK